jgi:hypothetical protein
MFFSVDIQLFVFDQFERTLEVEDMLFINGADFDSINLLSRSLTTSLDYSVGALT